MSTFTFYLNTSGTSYINITDGSAFGNQTWTIDPGTLGAFQLSPNGGTANAGVSFALIVTAMDKWNNVKTDYGGTPTVESNNTQFFNATAGFTNGVASYTIYMNTTGINRIFYFC